MHRSAEWILNHRAWYNGPQRIRGVPIHLNHADPWKVWQYLKGRSGVRYLCMQRRNVLEQFVSHEQAMVHGRWQVRQAALRPELRPLAIDPGRFENFVVRMQSCRDRFENEFAAFERLRVWYEDLCQHTEATSLEVQRFLGASLVSRLQPGTVKVGRPLSEVVSNYAELKRHFRSSKFEVFFEPPAQTQLRRAA
jgi:hypothetical protein